MIPKNCVINGGKERKMLMWQSRLYRVAAVTQHKLCWFDILTRV